MDAKLTLRLNQQVIDRAKEYASRQEQSLSRIVEAYLRAITKDMDDEELEITPFVRSMSVGAKVSEDVDPKEFYEHLLRKHK